MFLKLVSAPDKSALRVIWNKDGWETADYLVNAAFLKAASDQVRRELDRLSATYSEAVDARTGEMRNEAVIMPVLRNLAVAGHKLYRILFGTSALKAKRLSVQIGKLKATDRKLNILVAADVAIPFGLIYDLDPDDLADTVRGVFEQGGFWGGCLQIAAMPGLYEDLDEGVSDVRMLALINRNEFKLATTGLRAPPTSDISSLLDRPLGTTYSRKGFDEFIDRASKSSAIVYFFGHCANQVLHVSPNEQLDAADLHLRLSDLMPFDEPEDATRSLVFLNACYTGISNDKNDFLSACHKPGLCGFVGSEAELPGRFAMRYGHAFLTSIFDGWSVGQTTTRLARELWPYSLLYCCYANPDFRVRTTLAPSAGNPQSPVVAVQSPPSQVSALSL
jgi:hypothetical protein